MNNRVNQAVLIFAIIVVIAWNYLRYVNGKRTEKYEMDKSEIMNHIKSEEKLDSILVMTAAAKLTTDEEKIQNAYTMAEANQREELTQFFQSL